MTFPTTGVLDDFTRANENPLSDGGAWGGPVWSGDAALEVVSDQCQGTESNYCEAVWETEYPFPEVYFHVTGFPDGGWQPAAWACLSDADTSTPSGYYLWTQNTNEVHLDRIDAGVTTPLIDATGLTFADGDGFGMSVGGDGTLTAWHQPGGSGAWVSLDTATDTTYTTGKLALAVGDDTGAFTDFGGGAGVLYAPVVSKRGLYLQAVDLTGAVIEGATGRPAFVKTQTQPQVTIPLSDSRTGEVAVSMYEDIAAVLATATDDGVTSAATVVVKVVYINPKGESVLALNGILMNPEADFDAETVTCQLHDHTMRLKKRNLSYASASIDLSWGVDVTADGSYYTDTDLTAVGLERFSGINSIYGIPLDGYGLRLLLMDASHGASDWPGGDGTAPSMGIRYALGDSANSVDNANQQPAYVEKTADGLTTWVPPTGVGGLIGGINPGSGFTASLTEGSAVMTDVSFSGATDDNGDTPTMDNVLEYMALDGPGIPDFAYVVSTDADANTITMSQEATENVADTEGHGLNAFVAEDSIYCQLTRGDCVYDDLTDMVQSQGAFECDWVPIDKDHTGFSGATWESGQFIELYTANQVGSDRSQGNTEGNVPVVFVHGYGGFHLVWSPDADSLVTYDVECGPGGDSDPNDYYNKVQFESNTTGTYGFWENWDQATSAGTGDDPISNAVLANRAKATLTAYQNPPQFITATIDTDVIGSYCYGTDFFLGDTVTVFAKRGKVQIGPLAVRITQIGITQVDENGNCQLQLTMVPYLTASPGVNPEDV